MTLLEIQMLIHYHCFPTDYRDGDFSAPAVRTAINYFRDDVEMLETISDEENDKTEYARVYKLTGRGTAFVNALSRLPLPKQIWVME